MESILSGIWYFERQVNADKPIPPNVVGLKEVSKPQDILDKKSTIFYPTFSCHNAPLYLLAHNRLGGCYCRQINNTHFLKNKHLKLGS